ncbi:hypothetical protein PO909_031926 [Leuciscus waleckii]
MDQRAVLPVSCLILPSLGHDSSTLYSSDILLNDKTTSLTERKGHTAGPQAAGAYFKLRSMFPLASVDLRLCFYFRHQVAVLCSSTAPEYEQTQSCSIRCGMLLLLLFFSFFFWAPYQGFSNLQPQVPAVFLR